MKEDKIAVCDSTPEISGAAKLSKMTKRERRKLGRDSRIQKYIQPIIQREKEQRRSRRRAWWTNNWIGILGILLTLIGIVVSIILSA